MVNGFVLTLPLPTKYLSPNARCHWRTKAEAVKAYRSITRWAAATRKPAGWETVDAASVRCKFYFRVQRKRDRDNLLSMMKPAFDGLADAGIIANDSGFTYLPIEFGYDKTRERVEIEIVPTLS